MIQHCLAKLEAVLKQLSKVWLNRRDDQTSSGGSFPQQIKPFLKQPSQQITVTCAGARVALQQISLDY